MELLGTFFCKFMDSIRFLGLLSGLFLRGVLLIEISIIPFNERMYCMYAFSRWRNFGTLSETGMEREQFDILLASDLYP